MENPIKMDDLGVQDPNFGKPPCWSLKLNLIYILKVLLEILISGTGGICCISRGWQFIFWNQVGIFFPKQSFDHPDGTWIPSQKIMKKSLVLMDSDCVLQKGCSSTTYTVWNIFPIQLGIIIPTDELIFFRGVGIPPPPVIVLGCASQLIGFLSNGRHQNHSSPPESPQRDPNFV